MSHLIDSLEWYSFEELKRRLVTNSNQASGLPTYFSKAIALATAPDCELHDFVREIEKDATLAVEVLKLANSPLFAGSDPVANLGQAAIRLGMKRCRNLILTTCAKRLMNNLSIEIEWAGEVLRKHSLMTASTCTLLNQHFGLGFCGEEYTAGLLHDFGRLALAVAVPEQFLRIDDLSLVEPADLLIRERNVLSTDHCEFAGWYLEAVAFPRELLETVRWHHVAVGSVELEHPLLVSLLRTADDFSNYLQRTKSFAGYDVGANQGLRDLSHVLPSVDFETEFAHNLKQFADQIYQSLSTNGVRI